MVPDFILIGAGRSGTTSLYHYLAQHPQIAMSQVKETNYFCWCVEGEAIDDVETAEVTYLVRSDADYTNQFSHALPTQLCGEASPRYLYAPGVAERIASDAPHARLIAILRNPIERAWSNWMGLRNAGAEDRSFEQMIEAEIRSLERPLQPGERSILRAGMYHEHLSRYLEVVPRNRLLVLLFDDFKRAPGDVLASVFRFLEVDQSAVINVSVRFNPTGVPRNQFLDRITAKSPLTAALKTSLPTPIARPLYRTAMRLRASNRARPDMSAQARTKLQELYRADTEALEYFLGRDLSAWLGRSEG
ncbi:sulfotransferase family protein [Tropicimonas aquimaris]|uniref:Sulfotransferase family protein n=1 Tax=Tropicimonas aquimaris TaxID=914152 RepID=A0ABW3INQ4_9RHOB